MLYADQQLVYIKDEGDTVRCRRVYLFILNIGAKEPMMCVLGSYDYTAYRLRHYKNSLQPEVIRNQMLHKSYC